MPQYYGKIPNIYNKKQLFNKVIKDFFYLYILNKGEIFFRPHRRKGQQMNRIKSLLITKQLKNELSIKDGVVKIDTTTCDGCENYVTTCTQNANIIKRISQEDIRKLAFKGHLKVKIKGENKAYIHPKLCTSCGLCMKTCYEFAIHKTANSTIN